MGGTNLLRLVGVGQRNHHPDDVEVVEGGAGAEGAGQHCRLTPGHLDAALGHGHIQGPYTHCGRQTGGANTLAMQLDERYKAFFLCLILFGLKFLFLFLL